MAFQNFLILHRRLKNKTFLCLPGRCHQEEISLFFGIHRKDVDEIIADLIGENYLNEERRSRLISQEEIRKHGVKNK